MVSNRSTINELESFLKKILIPHGISNIEVEPVGTSEIGDGFLGDITFLQVKGIKDNSPTELKLVVKSGKKSQAVRNGAPIHGAFQNEANLYTKILPAFQTFEKDRGVKNVFNSVPKCFGAFISDNEEYIAFQNLKAIGYDLNDKLKTMPRQYTEAVLAQYAHWHAISAAMQDQEPEKFKALVDQTDNIWIKFADDAEKMYDSIITTALDICDDTDKNILTKFESLRKNLKKNVSQEEFSRRFQVIVHGDCWNNNYLFKEENNEVEVAIIDWQITRTASPIIDLAYHIFATLSPENYKVLDKMLEKYYEIFSSHLRILGSDPDKVYPKSMFMKDWKELAYYGILVGMVTTQTCLTDKANMTDLTTTLENGMSLADNFSKEVSCKDSFKQRLSAIMEYAVQSGIIT